MLEGKLTLQSFKVGPPALSRKSPPASTSSARNRAISAMRGVPPPPPPQPDAKRSPIGKTSAKPVEASPQRRMSLSSPANATPTTAPSEQRYRLFCGGREVFSTLPSASDEHVVKGSICSSTLRIFPEYFHPLHSMLSGILRAVSWHERMELTWKMLPWALRLPDEAVRGVCSCWPR